MMRIGTKKTNIKMTDSSEEGGFLVAARRGQMHLVALFLLAWVGPPHDAEGANCHRRHQIGFLSPGGVVLNAPGLVYFAYDGVPSLADVEIRSRTGDVLPLQRIEVRSPWPNLVRLWGFRPKSGFKVGGEYTAETKLPVYPGRSLRFRVVGGRRPISSIAMDLRTEVEPRRCEVDLASIGMAGRHVLGRCAVLKFGLPTDQVDLANDVVFVAYKDGAIWRRREGLCGSMSPFVRLNGGQAYLRLRRVCDDEFRRDSVDVDTSSTSANRVSIRVDALSITGRLVGRSSTIAVSMQCP